MDEDPSSFLALTADPLDGGLYHHELDPILHPPAPEPESGRCALLGAEIARLHELLRGANASLKQARSERDMYKAQLDDQLTFRRGPLEAQLNEAKRALFEQRLQFRSIVDILAVQRDWVREWAIQCQENARLRDQLAAREGGTEAEGLRRELLDAHVKLAEVSLSIKQREAVVAVHESKVRSFKLEVERLLSSNDLLKEQVKRLWKRLPPPSGVGVQPDGASRREEAEDAVRNAKRKKETAAPRQGLAEKMSSVGGGE